MKTLLIAIVILLSSLVSCNKSNDPKSKPAITKEIKSIKDKEVKIQITREQEYIWEYKVNFWTAVRDLEVDGLHGYEAASCRRATRTSKVTFDTEYGYECIMKRKKYVKSRKDYRYQYVENLKKGLKKLKKKTKISK